MAVKKYQETIRLATQFELASIAQSKKNRHSFSYGKIDSSIQKMLNAVLLGMEKGGSIAPLRPNLIPLNANGVFDRATHEAINVYVDACDLQNNGDIDLESVVFPRLKQDFAKYSSKKPSNWQDRAGSTDKTNHAIFNWNDMALSNVVEALRSICCESKLKKKAESAGIARLIERVSQKDNWEENDFQDILKTIEFLKSSALKSNSDKRQQFLQKMDVWAAKSKECWYGMFPNFDSRNSVK